MKLPPEYLIPEKGKHASPVTSVNTSFIVKGFGDCNAYSFLKGSIQSPNSIGFC